MKSTIYIFLFILCFSLTLSAQKYKTMVMQDWKNGNWVNTMRSTNAFDGNGNIIREGSDMWNDTTKVWENSVLTTHTLNQNSTINFSITQMWQKESKTWEDVQKTLYTYDGSKNLLTQKSQMFFGDSWMDFGILTNTYNTSNQLIQSLDQDYDMMTMQMKNTSKSTHSYNSDGTEYQTLSQTWGASGPWTNSNRSTYAYNPNKKIISLLSEEYKNETWQNRTKSAITYNSNGTIKETLTQEWDIATGAWKDLWKENYTYNSDKTTNQLLITEWKADLNNWENQSKMIYTYDSSTSLNPGKVVNNQIKVFPNPFRNEVFIQYESSKDFNIQLINSSGQIVRNINKSELLNTINLGSLCSGVYLLNVISPELNQTIKILKLN